MTVVYSAVSHRFLIMAADSAVQNDFGTTREYETGRKFWWIPQIGGVSWWGARDGNTIGTFLQDKWAEPKQRTIDDLARDVHSFLVGTYSPDKVGLGDVGFHIAGFRPDRSPALYHSFWNTPRNEVSRGIYSIQLLDPVRPMTQFLYNGREDLAEHVIAGLLNDLRAGRDTHFDHRSPGGAAYLASLVLRFSAEISMEVGPPFVMRLMTPEGQDLALRFDDLNPPALDSLEMQCAGFSVVPWERPAAT